MNQEKLAAKIIDFLREHHGGSVVRLEVDDGDDNAIFIIDLKDDDDGEAKRFTIGVSEG